MFMIFYIFRLILNMQGPKTPKYLTYICKSRKEFMRIFFLVKNRWLKSLLFFWIRLVESANNEHNSFVVRPVPTVHFWKSFSVWLVSKMLAFAICLKARQQKYIFWCASVSVFVKELSSFSPHRSSADKFYRFLSQLVIKF